MSNSFAHFGLTTSLTDALARGGVTEPFPIQTEAIPPALEGSDIQGKAPTGSGKTLAFGLPVLQLVGRAKGSRPRALILAPTRELAAQIETSLRPLAKAVGKTITVVYGGVGYGPQKMALRKGADVLVATPGRLEDLIDQRVLDLRAVDLVVVDEADRMADMGFLPAVRRILRQTSSDRQTLLFSATLDGEIAVLSRDFQVDPVRVEVPGFEDSSADAVHHFWRVDHADRVAHVADVVRASGKTIVFTRTRHGADRLAKQLGNEGLAAVTMHGGRSQSQRERALREFSKGRASALIATDVAARGIHVDDVATVVHFDVAGDAKDYKHRSGRTARAGAGGTVVTMVLRGQEREVSRIQRELGMETVIGRPSVEELTESHVATKPVDRPMTNARELGDTVSLYVGNLPWSAQEHELQSLFSAYGNVGSVTLVNDRRGRPKGYGFVEMSGASVGVLVDRARGVSLGGRKLQVRPAN